LHPFQLLCKSRDGLVSYAQYSTSIFPEPPTGAVGPLVAEPAVPPAPIM
jgi:hypothetical protein